MGAKLQITRPLDHFVAETAAALGLPPKAAQALQVEGDETLPSAFAVTDLAAASIAAAGMAAVDLTRDGRAGPRVVVDRHLASTWFSWSIRPLGWTIASPWDAIAGDYRAADGWIRLHTNAPHHRAAVLTVLGCAGAREEVAAAVAQRGADALEATIVDAGGCAARMRSAAEWREHPQGRAVASEPLIAIARTGAAPSPVWRPDPARPLAGLKVLDLTRVLAGPVATRFLGGLGAEVLRIDPPDWEEPSVVPDVTLGKRCARLDLRRAEDRSTFDGLLRQADLLVHGYRPDALERLGYGTARRRAINPALIDIALCAYGWSGPWSARRGFDSLVQMSCGIADAGMRWHQADGPTPLPVQALDHATGYLMAAAAIRGVTARLRDGVAVSARVSLARTAALLMAGGGSPAGAGYTGPQEEDFAPGLEHTPWGAALRLRSPLTIDGMALRWDGPAAELGSARPEW